MTPEENAKAIAALDKVLCEVMDFVKLQAKAAELRNQVYQAQLNSFREALETLESKSSESGLVFPFRAAFEKASRENMERAAASISDIDPKLAHDLKKKLDGLGK